jgi:hypothetical protein
MRSMCWSDTKLTILVINDLKHAIVASSSESASNFVSTFVSRKSNCLSDGADDTICSDKVVKDGFGFSSS